MKLSEGCIEDYILISSSVRHMLWCIVHHTILKEAIYTLTLFSKAHAKLSVGANNKKVGGALGTRSLLATL